MSFVERLADNIQAHANAKQVYGEPVEKDGVTIIPVAKVQFGVGGGGLGSGHAERGGGGGGAKSTPVGFIEIRNGIAEYRPLPVDPMAVVGAAIAGALAGAVAMRILRR